MGNTLLTYYIYEALLMGEAGGKPVNIYALSGGGGMSKKGITDHGMVNNPMGWTKKTTYKNKSEATKANRGGPIPPGEYAISKPDKSRGYLASYLKPVGVTEKLLKHIKRDGFLIHGSGPVGSDGCIVPCKADEFKSLMDGMIKDKGGRLFVVENIGNTRFA